MVIRFKKYKDVDNGDVIKAIRITEANVKELGYYINRQGGICLVTNSAGKKPYRIRVKQRNYGENWGKIDWRVANIGDYIIRHEFPNGEHHREKGALEFSRVRKSRFEAALVPVVK